MAEAKAASEGREVSMGDIEAAVKTERQKVMDHYSTIGNTLLDRSEKIISEIGLDGLSISMSSTGDVFFREVVKRFIDTAGAKFHTAKRILVFDGYIGYVSNSCQWLDYVISTTHGNDRLSEVQDLFNSFMSMENARAEQFLSYLSLENDSWKVPYKDILSSVAVMDAKYKSLSLWKPLTGERTGGMALRGVENDYENKYSVLRQTIQYLNLK